MSMQLAYLGYTVSCLRLLLHSYLDKGKEEMFGWHSYAWRFFLFVCSKGGSCLCDVLISLRTLTL